MQELAKLAEKDPEFYKYLQENDQELLDFDTENVETDDLMEEDGDEYSREETPVLTREILKTWQKALLEVCRFDLCSEAGFIIRLSFSNDL